MKRPSSSLDFLPGGHLIQEKAWFSGGSYLLVIGLLAAFNEKRPPKFNRWLES